MILSKLFTVSKSQFPVKWEQYCIFHTTIVKIEQDTTSEISKPGTL